MLKLHISNAKINNKQQNFAKSNTTKLRIIRQDKYQESNYVRYACKRDRTRSWQRNRQANTVAAAMYGNAEQFIRVLLANLGLLCDGKVPGIFKDQLKEQDDPELFLLTGSVIAPCKRWGG